MFSKIQNDIGLVKYRALKLLIKYTYTVIFKTFPTSNCKIIMHILYVVGDKPPEAINGIINASKKCVLKYFSYRPNYIILKEEVSFDKENV